MVLGSFGNEPILQIYVSTSLVFAHEIYVNMTYIF